MPVRAKKTRRKNKRDATGDPLFVKRDRHVALLAHSQAVLVESSDVQSGQLIGHADTMTIDHLPALPAGE
jgi:hypothetical protein